jgi:hypothetical protein
METEECPGDDIHRFTSGARDDDGAHAHHQHGAHEDDPASSMNPAALGRAQSNQAREEAKRSPGNMGCQKDSHKTSLACETKRSCGRFSGSSDSHLY